MLAPFLESYRIIISLPLAAPGKHAQSASSIFPAGTLFDGLSSFYKACVYLDTLHILRSADWQS